MTTQDQKSGLAIISALVAPAVLGVGVLYADTGDQLAKLLADDGVAFHRFGEAVGISGTTAIVGTSRDSANGAFAGAAYLFDTNTDVQLFKLLPNDGAPEDGFGFTVAVDGAVAVVGAYRNNSNGVWSGSAYLFDTATGQQLFKLIPTDGLQGDQFGYSVAISGATAIVGAINRDNNGFLDIGSAYLFDATTGQQTFKLLPDDGAEFDRFGWSVAISGTTAIIGMYADDDNGFSSGSAYLFDTTTGQQLFKLLPTDGAANDFFGWSVAISGTTAIVGARFDNDLGPDSGSAYLFDTATGQQLFKLLPTDGAADDEFGYTVAISGDTAIVGSYWDDDNGDNSGSAYLFDATTGQQIIKITADDGVSGDEFGKAVAVSGNTAIVGAHLDSDNGLFSGSAYLFDAGVVASCPGDLNGDGVTDTADLGVLLSQFNTANPDADINGDGIVDTADLGILLGVFGTACP